MTKIKVGDKVFCKYSCWGTNDRHKTSPTEGEVVKVGRKYFSVRIRGAVEQFEMAHLPLPHIAGSGNYSLFESEEQYLEHKNHEDNCGKLAKFFKDGKHEGLSKEKVEKLIVLLGLSD